nr:MAG TPA: hypothetical protein [Caudoviricetes sp.]
MKRKNKNAPVVMKHQPERVTVNTHLTDTGIV